MDTTTTTKKKMVALIPIINHDSYSGLRHETIQFELPSSYTIKDLKNFLVLVINKRIENYGTMVMPHIDCGYRCVKENLNIWSHGNAEKEFFSNEETPITEVKGTLRVFDKRINKINDIIAPRYREFIGKTNGELRKDREQQLLMNETEKEKIKKLEMQNKRNVEEFLNNSNNKKTKKII